MECKIALYFHCAKCDEENDSRTTSMQDYSRLSVGWTPKGVQVWCHRHEINVIALDFMGQEVDYDVGE